MKKIMTLICLLVILFGSSACSTFNSDFDCPNKAGVMCKSLDQINDIVDRNQIEYSTERYSAVTNPTPFQPFPQQTQISNGTFWSKGETLQRIWITPFKDGNGNYHQDTFIYAVMKSDK